MTDKSKHPESAGELRRQAEKRLQHETGGMSKAPTQISPEEMQRTLHELLVHQIELEMQNEELRRIQIELDTARARYFDLYDLAPVGYCILSEHGLIEEANLTAAVMLGSTRSVLIKHPISRFIGAQDKDLFYLHNRQLFKTGKAQSFEVQMVKMDGTKCWVRMTATAVADKDGKISVSHLVWSDITERKKVDEELIMAKEKAEESDRLKSAFLSNMSHEIRTPMNGILGFAQLLKEPKLTSREQQEFIGIIEKSGERLLNTINDIICISKIESGQIELSLGETNINEPMEYIYTFFKREVEQKGMRLFYKHPLPDKEVMIKTDREKIYGILTNLVKNAIKFSHTGDIEFGYVKKNKILEFYVKDSGIGIPADRQNAVFDRFVQADSAGHRAYEGSGLGLSIAKAYVEMLGGKIWATSVEGEGSTFYFTLPWSSEPENAKPENRPEDKPVPAEHESRHVKPLKVLIAEDDENSEKLMRIAICFMAKEVLSVKNGVDAVAACRSHTDLDLILMDIKMPKMDGYDAIRQIRQFNRNVVIVAQTGYALSGERKTALAAGCDDYLAKPFKIPVLTELIKKHF